MARPVDLTAFRRCAGATRPNSKSLRAYSSACRCVTGDFVRPKPIGRDGRADAALRGCCLADAAGQMALATSSGAKGLINVGGSSRACSAGSQYLRGRLSWQARPGAGKMCGLLTRQVSARLNPAMKITRRDSLPARLLFLWLCLSPTLTLAQARPTAEDARQTEKVDAYVKEQMKALHIPGLSLVVLRGGDIILAKGYGKSNLELGTPASERTAYALYSITKTFTAVAAMMLVEEGKVALEDPISKHLTDLPAAWRGVTGGVTSPTTTSSRSRASA
jgi:hypothetical protein